MQKSLKGNGDRSQPKGAPSQPKETLDVALKSAPEVVRSAGGDEIAKLTKNSYGYKTAVTPMEGVDLEDASQRESFYSAVLQHALDTCHETGNMVELTGPEMRKMWYDLADGNYTQDETFPGLKKDTLEMGSIKGEKKLQGSDELFRGEKTLQIEFSTAQRWADGTTDRSIITPKKNKDGSTSLRIVPKKTMLVYGFGTIGSKVAIEARKLGINVVVANRSPNDRALLAQELGFPLIPLNDECVQAYEKKGFAIKIDSTGKPVTADSYFENTKQSLNNPELEKVDIVFDGLDNERSVVVNERGIPVLGSDGKALVELPSDGETKGMHVAEVTNSLIYSEEIFKQYDTGDNAITFIHQGSNDPELIANGKVVETAAMDAAHISFKTFEGARHLFVTSCVTTTQLGLFTPILADPDLKPGSLSLDVFTIRRAHDPGSGQLTLSADGLNVIDMNYHHGDDALAFLGQNFSSGVNLLKGFKKNDGMPAYVTDATKGSQTKFHIGRVVLDGTKTDGTPLDADYVRKLYEGQRRLAVLKPRGGKFNPGWVYDILINRIGKNHPFLSAVQVIQRRDGKVGLNFITPQESNVVPNNESTVYMALGLMKPEDVHYANDEVDQSLGVASYKHRIEDYIENRES